MKRNGIVFVVSVFYENNTWNLESYTQSTKDSKLNHFSCFLYEDINYEYLKELSLNYNFRFGFYTKNEQEKCMNYLSKIFKKINLKNFS